MRETHHGPPRLRGTLTGTFRASHRAGGGVAVDRQLSKQRTVLAWVRQNVQ